MRVHPSYVIGSGPFFVRYASPPSTHNWVRPIFVLVVTPPPTCNWSPPFFCPSCKYTLDTQLGPTHFCPICKSTLDTQLGVRPILSQLQFHPQHAIGGPPFFLSQLQVHRRHATGAQPIFVLVASPTTPLTCNWGTRLFPSCKSTLDVQLGGRPIFPQLQFLSRYPTGGPTHLCPSCKSTFDTQLGPTHFSQLQVHPGHTIGPDPFLSQLQLHL